jgi:uncharacterized protein (TIGR00369 family)
LTSEPRIIAAPGLGAFEFAEHGCFACGSLNRDGIGMTIHVERGRSWSELTIERRFEGWEGTTHGGISATLLDEVMGWALAADDAWGVTARLSVDYRAPMMVGATVRAEGWIVSTRRRVIETAGRIVDAGSGVEYATGTATYVTVDAARKRALHERYGMQGTDTPARVANG